MKTMPLGALATVTTGGTPDRGQPTYWGGSVPWVGTSEIDFGLITQPSEYLTEAGLAQSAAKLLPKGTLLMAMYGQGSTRGKVAVLGIQAATNQACAAILPKDNAVEPEYLFHVLEASYEKIRRLSNTGSQENLNTTIIREISIPMPAKAEREAIIGIAKELGVAVTAATELIDSLEQRKHGLMQQLLTGRRRLKGFKGNWKAKRIGDFAVASSAKNKCVAELPVLSCTKHAGLVDSLSYFGRQMFSESTATYKLVKRGQFAYATNHIEEGSVGYQNLYDTALISPMYTVFEVNKEMVDDLFFYKVLKTEQMRREFESATSASVARRGSLRWPVFAKLKINLPPKDEQIAISRILDDQDEQLRLANDQLQMLKAQKRALMQKLLSGQWRMPAKAMKGKKS